MSPKKLPTTQRRMSTSFSEDEVRVVCEIFATLRRGGDASMFVRADAARAVQVKFQSGLQRLSEEE